MCHSAKSAWYTRQSHVAVGYLPHLLQGLIISFKQELCRSKFEVNQFKDIEVFYGTQLNCFTAQVEGGCEMAVLICIACIEAGDQS